MAPPRPSVNQAEKAIKGGGRAVPQRKIRGETYLSNYLQFEVDATAQPNANPDVLSARSALKTSPRSKLIQSSFRSWCPIRPFNLPPSSHFPGSS
mmetsp:Transcript_6158/g.26058  ORF Transcript_6158/g.26058 Transcript_6158/m.26058 type:complete len:95 (-) Transcript_6158:23-307(-)